MSRRWNLRARARQDDGQDLMEYGMLTALIVIIAMAGVSSVGSAINSIFWEYIDANF